MALISCPECSKEVSDSAESCPNCGYSIFKHLKSQSYSDPIRQSPDIKAAVFSSNDTSKSSMKEIYLAIGTIIFLILMVSVFSSGNKNNDITPLTTNVPPKEFTESDRRQWFTSAKALLNNKSLKHDLNDLDRIKESLKAVTSDMKEYTEAQVLLEDTNKRLAKAVIEEDKKLLAQEAAKFTKAGKRIHAKHPDWDADLCNTIGKGHIYVGMTAEQVRAAWGRPYDINRTTTANSTNEQWVMHEMGGSYVYFEDGICTTIQN